MQNTRNDWPSWAVGLSPMPCHQRLAIIIRSNKRLHEYRPQRKNIQHHRYHVILALLLLDRNAIYFSIHLCFRATVRLLFRGWCLRNTLIHIPDVSPWGPSVGPEGGNEVPASTISRALQELTGKVQRLPERRLQSIFLLVPDQICNMFTYIDNFKS